MPDNDEATIKSYKKMGYIQVDKDGRPYDSFVRLYGSDYTAFDFIVLKDR